MLKPPTIINLMGPTASGKTALAMELVGQLPVDIISVDSAMVYRGMDIGTAKPTAEELKQAPHRLLDICDPNEIYSVGRFCEEAWKEINKIHQEERIPLLVGGTMLYFHALKKGLATLPSANEEIRKEICSQASEKGWSALHKKLASIDPQAAKKIHPNDGQRIQRALEIYHATGKPMSSFYESQKNQSSPKINTINLIISPKERVVIHQRIEKRFDQMLAHGLIDEVKALFNRGDLNEDLPSLRTVGYRQIWRYLKGDCDYATMRETAIAATRQLAKRQFTWLRRFEDAKWFDADSSALQKKMIHYLNKMNEPHQCQA